MSGAFSPKMSVLPIRKHSEKSKPFPRSVIGGVDLLLALHKLFEPSEAVQLSAYTDYWFIIRNDSLVN